MQRGNRVEQEVCAHYANRMNRCTYLHIAVCSIYKTCILHKALARNNLNLFTQYKIKVCDTNANSLSCKNTS
jgi:hypothetical protein